jgi:hypothetical protein
MQQAAEGRLATFEGPQYGSSYTEIRKLSKRLLSATWLTSMNFAGSAHPAYFVFSFNFDLQTGKEITLDSLFDPLPKGLEKLAQEASIALDMREDSHGRVDADSELLEHFTFGPSGLEVTFDRGAVLAGADGRPRVTIPYDRLEATSNGIVSMYAYS